MELREGKWIDQGHTSHRSSLASLFTGSVFPIYSPTPTTRDHLHPRPTPANVAALAKSVFFSWLFQLLSHDNVGRPSDWAQPWSWERERLFLYSWPSWGRAILPFTACLWLQDPQDEETREHHASEGNTAAVNRCNCLKEFVFFFSSAAPSLRVAEEREDYSPSPFFI